MFITTSTRTSISFHPHSRLFVFTLAEAEDKPDRSHRRVAGDPDLGLNRAKQVKGPEDLNLISIWDAGSARSTISSEA